ncbi:transposase family protein [Okeania sp. KiyG1]|uniref:transposase family protein n=1 Tax=Okeania sp. KiyG1 TaxID=2720165 RepID=UPI001F2FC587|nr:transposase family protein [Okeania sp. KiyG1]
MDGTERPVQRPTDSEKQKLNYSGKKTSYSQTSSSSRPKQASVSINSGTRRKVTFRKSSMTQKS